MDVNVASHGVHVAQAVKAGFTARKPKNPGQNPVAAGETGGKFGAVKFSGGSTADKDGVWRSPGSDLGAHDMAAQWSAKAAFLLPRTIAGRGDRKMFDHIMIIN